MNSLEVSKYGKEFFVYANDTNTIKNIYSNLKSDEHLPDIDFVSLYNEECTGLYYDINNSDYFYIPYGRLFSDEEIKKGADVALVGFGYFDNLTKDKIDAVWDSGITYKGRNYKAVGNYQNSYFDNKELNALARDILPNNITVPLNTFLKNGYNAKYLRIEFKNNLNEKQIKYLKNKIKKYQDVKYTQIPTLYDKHVNQAYYRRFIPNIAIYFVVLISIISMISYWINKEIVRYRIYMICGANRKQIAFLIFITAFMLITPAFILSYFIRLLIMNIPSGYFDYVLPQASFLIYYVIMLLFIELLVYIKINKRLFLASRL